MPNLDKDINKAELVAQYYKKVELEKKATRYKKFLTNTNSKLYKYSLDKELIEFVNNDPSYLHVLSELKNTLNVLSENCSE